MTRTINLLYRRKDGQQEKAAPKPDKKASAVRSSENPSQVNGDIIKKFGAKKGAKMRKNNRSKMGSEPKLGGGSGKLKIALLSVILVAAVAFIINFLGIVDFRSLLDFSGPTKKESIKPRAAKKSPAKTDKKPNRVTIKSPQEGKSRQAAQKATSQKRTVIAKKPPKTSPPKARRRPVRRRPKPTTSTKKTVIAQKPSKPITSTPTPVVAKKLPAPAISKAKPPVVKETPKPAVQTQKKGVPAKAELLPEERIFSYPYSVYLGSFKTLERAGKAISWYQKNGLSPYSVRVDLGDKGVWYRLFAGRFKNRGKAEVFIKEKGLADAKVKKTKHAVPRNTFLTKDDSTKKEGPEEEERLPKTTALSYPLRQ